ncbi:MAG TPA: hypothetical protein VIV58_23615 [Kofleriaceae bacterium]
MAISGLLRRMGFVKLDDFGLILTPEGRILSARSVVLDDGIGGKIVGWREDDLAAMELERWEPAIPRKAGKKVVPTLPQAARTVAPAAPPPLPGVRPFTGTMPLAAPMPTPPVPTPVVVPTPIAVAPAPIPAKPVATPKPAPVETAPVEEDDEWEWEIAVARARANAEWAAEAEAATRQAAKPAAKAKDPMSTDSWPKTEPLLEAWEPSGSPDRPIRVLPRKPSPTPSKPIVIAAAPLPRATSARFPASPATEPNIFVGEQTSPTLRVPADQSGNTIITSAQKPVSEHTSPVIAAPRATVIPVPTLPTALDPKSVIPRPRTTSSAPLRPSPAVMSPRRMSRGTPSLANRTEDTLVNGNTAPANDDLTSPGLLAPPPASSGLRVAAKQR